MMSLPVQLSGPWSFPGVVSSARERSASQKVSIGGGGGGVSLQSTVSPS